MKKLLGKILRWLLIPAVLLGIVYLALDIFHLGGVDAPEMQVFKPEEVQHLDQNWKNDWSPTGTKWFHHVNQGTKVLPYEWFLALEQPDLSPFHPHGRFVDGDFLYRFGFLPSETDPDQNPHGLPVGFTKQEDFVDPNDPKKQETRVVGLTCAACHTGEIHYKAPNDKLKAVRIEGGPAMINITLFQAAVGMSLFYTNFIEARFTRFADRVLELRKEMDRAQKDRQAKGQNAGYQNAGYSKGKDQPSDDTARAELRAELKAFLDVNMSAQAYAQKKGLYAMNLGFSRTDALGLIGNRVFGPLGNENLTVANAPVNFPHLWDTAWFDWVQYNASIRMPLVRNIGEALGVGALVKIDDIKPSDRFPSSVNIEHLHQMEAMLGGNKPYAGLRSPKWEDTDLPKIDKLKRDRGEILYKKYCQICHLPPPRELEAIVNQDVKDANGRKIWYDEGPKGSTVRVLNMRVADLQVIGTDANQALNFYRRLADLGYGGNTTSAAKGLYNVTGFIRNKFFTSKDFAASIPDGPDKEKMIAAKKLEFDRNRPFEDPLIDEGNFDLSDDCVISSVIVAQLGYKARPLNGIWATAPFLHNSSVPSLYQMLVPVKDRDKTFYLGTKMFDPNQVGFVTDAFPGGFKLDVSESGNTNLGHEYRNLTIDEMETAAKKTRPVDDTTPEDDRWADLIGVSTTQWKAFTDDQRREKISVMTFDLLKKRASATIPKGVIGPELSDTERWELVEFLKSI